MSGHHQWLLNHGERGVGNVRRVMRRISAVLCAVFVVCSLAGCVPQGKAVGDTQEREPAVAHEGIEQPDMIIGVIGSRDADMDALVLDVFHAADLQAPYVSTSTVIDPIRAACQGVETMTVRKVSVIMVNDIDVTAANRDDWNTALAGAREAGIPVVLLNPVNPPDDETLFAATFIINDRATEATPLNKAIATIIDDKPHPRQIAVSTIVS